MDAATKFKKQLFAEVKRGVSKFRVATRHGIKYRTLLRWCRAAGIYGDYSGPNKLGSRVPVGFKQRSGARAPKTLRMIALLKQGVSQGEVARRFGVAASWVSVLAKRDGIRGIK